MDTPPLRDPHEEERKNTQKNAFSLSLASYLSRWDLHSFPLMLTAWLVCQSQTKFFPLFGPGFSLRSSTSTWLTWVASIFYMPSSWKGQTGLNVSGVINTIDVNVLRIPHRRLAMTAPGAIDKGLPQSDRTEKQYRGLIKSVAALPHI